MRCSPQGRRRRRLLVVGMLLAGCGVGGQAPVPDAPTPGLRAAAEVGRHASSQGKVHLHLANHGPGDAAVASFQLRHPLFDVVPPADRESLFAPDGDARRVPVPVGRPRCERTDPTGAAVALGVRHAGEVRQVLVPLTDREPGLLRLHRLACAADAVRSVAAVELGPPWVREQGPGGPQVRTTLRLDRRAPGTVTVTDLLGSVLLTPTAARERPVVVLAAGRQSAAVDVVVEATRCDRHALIESKTRFDFPLFASIDGGEPARLTVTPSPPGRAALQRLLDETCATG